MIWILDTDTLIFYIRGQRILNPSGASQRRLRDMSGRIADRGRDAHARGDETALSAITLAELEFGARNSRQYDLEMQRMRDILAPFSLLDFTAAECAVHYGRLRKSLQDAGALIGSMDMLIAAHALALGATLVTHNARDFSRVKGLSVEDWTA